MKRILFIIAICVVTGSINAHSQRVLQLTKASSGKEILLKEGHRISYILSGQIKRIGIIEKVGDSTVTINGNIFELTNLQAIGRKRKGSGFLSFACGFLGGGIIIGAIKNANYDPCPTCTDAGSSGSGYTVVEVGLGLAVLGLGLNTAIRNSPKDVMTKWKLEIVDLSLAKPTK